MWTRRLRLSVIASLTLLSAPVLAVEAGVQGAAGPFGFSGNSGNDTLTVIDLGTGATVGEDTSLVPEGDYPYDVTIKPDGSEVWICGAVGDGVIVFDAIAHQITERVSLLGSEYPVDVVFNGDGSRAYVAARDSGTIEIIDTATYSVIDAIFIESEGFGPGKMAFSPARDELYVVEWYGGALYIVNVQTEMVTSVPVGTALWDLVLHPSQQTLYITDRSTDDVHVFDLDTRTVSSSIDVGDDPWGIDITPDGTRLVVANEDSHNVEVIGLAMSNTVIPIALPVDADPRDVDISADGSVAYVPSGNVAGSDAIYVIDMISPALIDLIPLGAVNPNAIAVTPDGINPFIFQDGFE